MPSEPQILIVGSGALATLFAARLSLAGVNVALIGGWEAALDAIAQFGARLRTPSGTHAGAVRVYRYPRECRGIPLALVLVKAWQTARAASVLTECLPSNGLALTLQNGMGNREILTASLGVARVAVGATTYGASLFAPGEVIPGGEGTVSLSEHPQIGAAAALLGAGGFRVQVNPQIESVLWGKLIINAAINPITALLNQPNGALLHNLAGQRLMEQAATEATQVAVAEGVRLPYPNPIAAVEDVVRRTAENISSMLQDIRRGAPTEIEAINGYITRRAAAHTIPCPVNSSLYQLVRAVVQV